MELVRAEPPLCVLVPGGGSLVQCLGCGWRGVPVRSGCPVCVEVPMTDVMRELEQLEREVRRPPPARGPVRQRVTGPGAGRNDPCPCGSGAKFKRCCGG